MSGFTALDVVSGWRLAPEPPPPVAARLQEVLVMTLLDEITALPPEPPPAAGTTTQGLHARAAANGYAGLVGQPLTCFLPGFAAGAPLQLSLAGKGYLPLSVATNLGPQAGYPDSFVPVDLGTVALHRIPVTLIARVVSATQTALVGASVTIDGIWPTVADLTNTTPSAPDLISLRSPLYSDRTTAASVAVRNLTQAPPAEAKTLLLPGNVGDVSIRLSDQVGLAPGTLIALTPADIDRCEYLTVTAIQDGGVSPAQPASAVLAFPLSRPHPAGATVIRMIPGAAGGANTLSRPASAGDVTLFPATMVGLDGAMQAVMISGGPADEYHPASTYTATSDSQGKVVLPPVHRIAQLRLRVHHASQASDLLTVVILPFNTETIMLSLAFP